MRTEITELQEYCNDLNRRQKALKPIIKMESRIEYLENELRQ